MKIYSAKQQRKLDAMAIELGIPSVLLMEHAAIALLHHIETLPNVLKKIVIVCGRGNNGGDGFALARLCFQKGYDVQLICHVPICDMSEDEQVYAKIAKKLGIPYYDGTALDKIQTMLTQADVLVDALFGSGLSRDIQGYEANVIACMNACDAYTIGVDIPSGLYADNGCIGGCVVKCDHCISFAYGKLGLYINEGIQAAGKVEIADIGIPLHFEKTMHNGIEILEKEAIKKAMPKRLSNSHKATYGKALLIGGSQAMSGALSMCAQACLRSGVGTLTCAAPKSVCTTLAKKLDECMFIPLAEERDELCADVQIENLASYDVIAIGPGLGRGAGALHLLRQVWACECPCIVDGDALYLLGQENMLQKRKHPTILTPHPKEFYYLSGIEVRETLKNPVESLKTLVESMYDVSVALKNTRTLIFHREQRYINIIGNDGLATGGSGDVLCGIALALLAQKASSIDALRCAVYLHAYCAHYLINKEFTTYSLLPSDLLEVLPKAIANVFAI